MGEVHSLITKHGVEMARSMAATKAERNAIEAAASIMGEEESRMGITHAGFAMTSLPHKRIEETVWRRSGPNTTLLVASGHTEQGRPIGVPYGSIARLILLYLQTEAIRTGSAEVELGRSMNAWLTKMNLAIGGKTYGLVRRLRSSAGWHPRMVPRRPSSSWSARLIALASLGAGSIIAFWLRRLGPG
jgi:hypothetical protein